MEEMRADAEQRLQVDTRLRYNEKIYLNRKGHSAEFKSITRQKRNNVPDGTGFLREATPAVGSYRMKHKFQDK